MSRPSFPALGFDPTPGEPDAVQTAMLRVQKAVAMVGETTERLATAVAIADDWDGDAAEEFSDHGDDLPIGLGKGAESMANVAAALADWSTKMTVNQLKADNLEQQAAGLKKRYEQAKAAKNDEAATRLHNELTSVRDGEARRLEAKHTGEAEAAAEKIRSGSDDQFKPENDNWLVQASDGVAKAADAASLALGAVSAALAATGVGLPVALVTELASTTTGAVGSVAGITQQVLGSRNAPGWTLAGIGALGSLIPGGGTAAAAARNAVRLTLKGGSKTAAREALKDLNRAVRAGGVPSVVDGVKGIKEHGLTGKVSRDLTESGRDVAKQRGIYGDLPSDPASRRAALQQLGLAEKQRDGMISSIDHTEQVADKAGIDIDGADKRALTAARAALVGGSPTDARLDTELGKHITEQAK